MTLNHLFNDIITNEKSRDLSIEIIVNDKVYSIHTIESDFDNGVLKVFPSEVQNG